MTDATPTDGETRLDALLRGMHPERDASTRWAFCACGDAVPAALDAIATFREAEGWTAIAPMTHARALGVRHAGPYTRITLTVHSSLEAVGFLAAVTHALAARGIPCNAVSAFHHDHLFVPAARADDALATLDALTRDASARAGR